MLKQLLLLLVMVVGHCSAVTIGDWLLMQLKEFFLPNFPTESEEVLREAAMTTPELIERDGYPAETHSVETKDGYILGVHRIPYGRKHSTPDGRIPVLFIPGLSCSSGTFILNGAISLGYILAENGFDVWMGNPRGTRYSRNHISLSPEEKEFWMYTMDDIGEYDIPAMIDFILNFTNSKHIQMVTHSMGGIVSLMTFANQSEYNNKVKGTVHLGPAVHMRYTVTLFRTLFDLTYTFQKYFDQFGIYEVIHYTNFSRWALFTLCPTENPFICEACIFSLTGYNPKIKEIRVTRYVNHCPTGLGAHQLIQYGQISHTIEVRAYDYGRKLNMQKYGKPEPPAYDFKRVTTPTAIFYSKNDVLADVIGMSLLIKELNLSIHNYLIPDPLFTHVDFLWADTAEKLVFIPLVETLRKMWKGKGKGNEKGTY